MRSPVQETINQDTGNFQQKTLIIPNGAVIETTPHKPLTKSSLAEPRDIQPTIKNVHNHLAANASNMTRSESISQQLTILLFCKLFDEIHADEDAPLVFQTPSGEPGEALKDRLQSYFQDQVKGRYTNTFSENEQIKLDPDSLTYVVKQLQTIKITGASRDIIGDTFEAIIGENLKGSKGQFFTPRNAISMMVDIVDPKRGDRILDPACGSGGFLVSTLMYLQKEYKSQTKEGVLIGVDKDDYLTTVANKYLTLLGAENAKIFNENSLSLPSEWSSTAAKELRLGTFDVVLTNPPFGKKLTIKDESILSQYDFGRAWSTSRKNRTFTKTNRLVSTPPQTLFIERCLEYLREGGRLGIVLPESLFGNPSYEYIMQYLRERMQFQAIISMPEELFQPYTHAKSCILIARKTKPKKNYSFFMGIADWCGHDSRGNPTIREDSTTGKKELLDDIPEISNRYGDLIRKEKNGGKTHTGFLINISSIVNNTFVPKFYDPEIEQVLKTLEATHELIPIRELVEKGVLSIKTGAEVGRLAYGTGTIPFIRTSDISNWEIKIDPKQCVSEEIYEKYKNQAGVIEGDILLVRDGTYLVGTCCILSKFDTKILFQSHIYRLRVNKPEELDPFLLFAALNSPIVKRQVKAKQFTQHIIETLGSRIFEIVLPIPNNSETKENLSARTRYIVETRAQLRQEARDVAMTIAGSVETPDIKLGSL